MTHLPDAAHAPATDFAFRAMGGTCAITIPTDQAICRTRDPRELARQAALEVLRIEQKYSRFRSDSVISHINDNAFRRSVPCDGETVALINHAANLHAQSQGRFDITSGVLRTVWRFAEKTVPTPDTVRSVLERVGWQHVDWDGHMIRFKREGMELDLGGLGKEYAADRAARMLRESGVTNGLVNLGGDIVAIGVKTNGDQWAVGVYDPFDKSRILGYLPIDNLAVATSGDYERRMVVDGKSYSHILDPVTGYPVDYWTSVTVVAGTCLLAGSVSTTVMLMGAHASHEWLDALKLPIVAVTKDGNVWSSAKAHRVH